MNSIHTQDLADRLDEFGLRFAEPIDLAELPAHDMISATLVHDHGRAGYLVAYSDPLTISSNDWIKPHAAGTARLLLLGPRVTERGAEMFRKLGIDYIDQAGNAFVDFAGVHIDVRGRRPLTSVRPSGPRTTRGGINLFSPKRSQVIFGLLTFPAMLSAPVRELAATAGVSLGQAQETLELLSRYNFLDEQRQIPSVQRDRLIDQWAAAFPTGLGSAARTERFSGDWHDMDDTSVSVSGEAAATDFLRPETAVLYTDKLPVEMIRRHRWRRNDERPTIFIRNRFWREPDVPRTPGPSSAPWLLVYADLLASNDGRQREAAAQVREQHL